MAFKLPELPYSKSALAPFLSQETLEFHHGKHHAGYVRKLNELIAGSRLAEMPLEEIVRTAGAGAIFNNAAQHWNHSFFWMCLKPKGGKPVGSLADELKLTFGGFDEFRKKFTEVANSVFGSGWAWLVLRRDGSLAIEHTPDAENPLPRGEKPLLTCDLWEHAYYIDYRNARANYIEAFWNIVNWEFVASNMR